MFSIKLTNAHVIKQTYCHSIDLLFLLQNEEKVQMVAQQQVQSQQKSAFDLNNLLKDLDEEKERTSHAETDLRTFKDRKSVV